MIEEVMTSAKLMIKNRIFKIMRDVFSKKTTAAAGMGGVPLTGCGDITVHDDRRTVKTGHPNVKCKKVKKLLTISR